MKSYPRFEMFIDCLWGLALIAAWHLLPFSLFAAEEAGVSMGSQALWLHAALLITFVYIYALRLRRHLAWTQQQVSRSLSRPATGAGRLTK